MLIKEDADSTSTKRCEGELHQENMAMKIIHPVYAVVLQVVSSPGYKISVSVF